MLTSAGLLNRLRIRYLRCEINKEIRNLQLSYKLMDQLQCRSRAKVQSAFYPMPWKEVKELMTTGEDSSFDWVLSSWWWS